MSQFHPTELTLEKQGLLRLQWSDGLIQMISPAELRRRCPCARCRAEALQPQKPASALTVLTPAQARPLAIQKMHPVGNYAYAIEFSDGHHTGIYSFELLRRIGEASIDAATE